MNQMQQELLQIRARVELTFTDEGIPWYALAEMARIHGMLTNITLQLGSWGPIPPQETLPEPKPQSGRGSPRKRFPSDEKRKKVAAEAKPKRKYTPPTKEPVLHKDAQSLVDCPLCGVGPGQACIKMTLGKNPRRANGWPHLRGSKKGEGVVTHEARRNALREMRVAMKATLEAFPGTTIEPPQPKVDPVVTEVYGLLDEARASVALDGETQSLGDVFMSQDEFNAQIVDALS